MKSLYTFNEIIDKINSHDYNTEMMLQHLIVRYKELENERDESRRQARCVRAFYEGQFLPLGDDGMFIEGWRFSWEEGSE